MRLIEEKKIFILEIICLIGIVLFTIIIQIVQGKIDEFNVDVIQQQNSLSSILNTNNSMEIRAMSLLVTGLLEQLGAKSYVVDPYKSSDESALDPELYGILKDYRNGNISKEEYGNKNIDYFGIKAIEGRFDYNERVLQLNSEIEVGAQCFNWKCEKINSFLYIFQIVCISIAFVGYLSLFFTIGNRINKKGKSV